MIMTCVNKIGFEAEFLLRDHNGTLVFPSDYSLPHDEFVILGEIRGDVGSSPEETTSNFLKEYYRVKKQVEAKNLSLDITGYAEVSPKFYASILTRMNHKTLSHCANINSNIDIAEFSDDVIDGSTGRLVNKRISTGFHIHFSSTAKKTYTHVNHEFNSVKLPFKFGEAEATFDLYTKKNGIEEKTVVEVGRITKPVIHHIVKDFDTILLGYTSDYPPLRYRNPGFYEVKDYGFEYRSLPFNQKIFDNLMYLADRGFDLLNAL